MVGWSGGESGGGLRPGGGWRGEEFSANSGDFCLVLFPPQSDKLAGSGVLLYTAQNIPMGSRRFDWPYFYY